MNIIFLDRTRIRVPVLDEEGKQEKRNGDLVFRDDEVEEQIEFETHPHELLSSVANRYIEFRKMPRPPPGIKPVLINAANGAWQAPNLTVKNSRALVFRLIGAPDQ